MVVFRNVVWGAVLAAGLITGGAADAALSPGDLIITELMADPLLVKDDYGEYFELYNASGSTINLNGLLIRDDDGSSHAISSDVFVAAGALAVLGVDANLATNGGYTADYVYNDFYLSNSSDEVVIEDGEIEIARLNYLKGDPFGDGVAFVLDNLASAVDGVAPSSSYIAEVIANDTLGTVGGDIGSPGTLGRTIAPEPVVPEPASLMLLGLGGLALLCRDRRGHA